MKQALRASVNLLPYQLRHRIRSVPGLAFCQRWLVDRVLAREPFVHSINAGPAAGLRFEVHLPVDKAVWAGTYESEVAEEISRSVPVGGVCFDIGGYRGYMSGVMALAGASKVVVFEPLAENQRALARLCALNPALPLDVRPFALGSKDGVEGLRVLADLSMAKLATSVFQEAAIPIREISVDVRRIDTLVASGRCPPPNVIKIDVEGAELDVLQGASAVLEEHLPIVFLEAHSAELERDCRDELVKLGYGIRRLEEEPHEREAPRHLICVPTSAG